MTDWITALKINEKGNIALTKEQAKQAWKEYTKDFWIQSIIGVSLAGNRQALNQKFALYDKFIASSNRTKADFYLLARLMGYNNAIEDLWNDFQHLFQGDFKAFLIRKMKGEDKKADEDIVEF